MIEFNEDKLMEYCIATEIKIQYKKNYKAAERPQIRESKDIYTIFNSIRKYNDKYTNEMDIREFFFALYLNKTNKIIAWKEISSGSNCGCVCDIQTIIRNALLLGVSSIIVCHNHPSGNLKASETDKKLTERLKEAVKLLDMELLDHIILGEIDGAYVSMCNEGLM